MIHNEGNDNLEFRNTLQSTGKNIKQNPEVVVLFLIFLFSFILDIYVLTRYNLSYGLDGPYYDLQVLNILNTGVPQSNDPPLVYYMLTPFVMLFGNSFLGIKVGMAFYGSLMVVPTFLLTKLFIKKNNLKSLVPAFLSAFLITINPFYFRMIGDFMQNLVGVLFLLFLIYFTIKWMEDMGKWKKYGTLTIAMLICSILTHLYTGILAVIMLLLILIFNMVYIRFKTDEVFSANYKIFGIMIVLTGVGLGILFTAYPVMFTKFITVLTFFNNSTGSSSTAASTSYGLMKFLNIPFLLGLFALFSILYKGFKAKTDYNMLLTAFAYLVVTSVIIVLSIFPTIDSQYQNRFLMLAFIPLALIVPIGIIFLNNLLRTKISSNKRLALVLGLSIIFACSGLYSANQSFSSMGPSITQDQYNTLLTLKSNDLGSEIDPSGIVIVDDYHTGYWIEYVLGMKVETGNITDVQQKYPDKKIYTIVLTKNKVTNSNLNSYSWSPLLPYSLPGLGINLQESKINNANNMPNAPNNLTHPNNGSPLNNSNFIKGNGFNRTNGTGVPPGGNMTDEGNMPPISRGSDSDLESGTLIYSGGSFNVCEIS